MNDQADETRGSKRWNGMEIGSPNQSKEQQSTERPEKDAAAAAAGEEDGCGWTAQPPPLPAKLS